MNKFKDIQELTDYFLTGKLSELPITITIGSSDYTYFEECQINLQETIETANKPKFALIYEAKDGDNYAVFGWNMDGRLQAVPASLQIVNKALVEADNRDVARSYEEKTIGISLDVILMGLNDNQPIKCKVDTGAELCSLDAQNIRIVPNQYEEGELVKFTFNDKVYTVALKQQQAVQSADGGVKYRPVISLSVKYNGQVYQDIDFNLNDRSDMPDPVLLGMNLLKTCDVLIDPKKESVEVNGYDSDREIIEKLLEETPVHLSDAEDKQPFDEDQIKFIIETIYKNPHISFADILRYMKSDTLKTVESMIF